jgi:hypothetical protein
MTAMNNPADLVTDKDFFGMTLGYDNIGNITTQTYSTNKPTNKVGQAFALDVPKQYNYSYAYDGLNRLLSGTLSQGNTQLFSLSGMMYDNNGNIKTLNRTWSGVEVDKLTYTYQPSNMNRIAPLGRRLSKAFLRPIIAKSVSLEA